ncbi:MAG: hypothetical protein R2795_13870 [Saprospiraceae bacterium]
MVDIINNTLLPPTPVPTLLAATVSQQRHEHANVMRPGIVSERCEMAECTVHVPSRWRVGNTTLRTRSSHNRPCSECITCDNYATISVQFSLFCDCMKAVMVNK